MNVMWEGLTPPYNTIVADPPWPDQHNITGVTRVGREKRDRRIGSHYSTLGYDEIVALDVASLASSDAHLYLWTTNTDLRRAYAVADAWGCEYKTLLTWVKRGHLGLGYYFRTQTEHVLFCVKGKLRTTDRSITTVFSAPKRGHSVKPPEFYDLVEKTSPGPYVELFARQPRLGWDHWGKGYETAPAAEAR